MEMMESLDNNCGNCGSRFKKKNARVDKILSRWIYINNQPSFQGDRSEIAISKALAVVFDLEEFAPDADDGLLNNETIDFCTSCAHSLKVLYNNFARFNESTRVGYKLSNFLEGIKRNSDNSEDEEVPFENSEAPEQDPSEILFVKIECESDEDRDDNEDILNFGLEDPEVFPDNDVDNDVYDDDDSGPPSTKRRRSRSPEVKPYEPYVPVSLRNKDIENLVARITGNKPIKKSNLQGNWSRSKYLDSSELEFHHSVDEESAESSELSSSRSETKRKTDQIRSSQKSRTENEPANQQKSDDSDNSETCSTCSSRSTCSTCSTSSTECADNDEDDVSNQLKSNTHGSTNEAEYSDDINKDNTDTDNQTDTETDDSDPDIVEKEYKCGMCEKTFATSTRRKKHWTVCKVGVARKFQCVHCGRRYSKGGALKVHLRGMHPLEDQTLPSSDEAVSISISCPVCAKQCDGEFNLNYHLQTKHHARTCQSFDPQTGSLKEEPESNGRRCYCEECKIKFNGNRDLRSHMYRCHPSSIEKYICATCGKSYVHARGLRDHEFTHTEDFKNNPKPYKCTYEDCDKAFSRQDLLTHHIKIYHQMTPEERKAVLLKNSASAKKYKKTPKNISCSICAKVIKSVSLRSHMLLKHSQTKNHLCEHCGRAFTFKGSLSKHVANVHLNIRNHPCTQCDKSFKTAAYLREHVIVIHENSWRFQCDQCDKKYKFEKNLKQHMKNTHKANYLRRSETKNIGKSGKDIEENGEEGTQSGDIRNDTQQNDADCENSDNDNDNKSAQAQENEVSADPVDPVDAILKFLEL